MPPSTPPRAEIKFWRISYDGQRQYITNLVFTSRAHASQFITHIGFRAYSNGNYYLTDHTNNLLYVDNHLLGGHNLATAMAVKNKLKPKLAKWTY